MPSTFQLKRRGRKQWTKADQERVEFHKYLSTLPASQQELLSEFSFSQIDYNLIFHTIQHIHRTAQASKQVHHGFSYFYWHVLSVYKFIGKDEQRHFSNLKHKNCTVQLVTLLLYIFSGFCCRREPYWCFCQVGLTSLK